MHAVKGGWVGQPFALAKCNDSAEKKSRIRRSKEERKALAESFIKKYQKLNNGNFPSLNLTHKEVGGSFYTVREIVREIIQENKVLGPSKLTPEEHDRFLKQYPLGSISIEPETDLSSSNESDMLTHYLPYRNCDTSEELVLNSIVQCTEPEHQRFNDGIIINGSSKEVEKKEEYDKAIYTNSQARESLELEENVAELESSKTKVTHVAADVKVETFPLMSGSRIAYGLDEISSEPSESTGTLEKEIENLEMEAGNNNSVVDGMNFPESSSGLEQEKAEPNLADPLLEKGCALVDEKPVENLEAPLLENSNGSTTKEGIVLDINDGTDCEVKDALTRGIKPIDALDGIHAQNLNGTTSSSSEQSISMEAILTKNNPNIQHGGNSPKGSNPTLDRMNLESWEETLGKPAKPETNPLLAFFKSFVAVFVKFWSE
ncbi:hypothetical protein LOK49_LG07G01386 [Camellia lanceoleosa]|uniref:Uncharacterized protein n=1 Tax=Camellia lanceoleosa TaxID=1840588 RepID=A0ACC0GZ74_9ERIC|nr:hypothetical protein LOK49_LG07G01386 [Camellia lanceoleosa]